MNRRFFTMMTAVVTLISTVVFGADFKPAVVYDMGGKFDKSFNEGVATGLEKFTKETGIHVMEFKVTNESQREDAMVRMIKKGATIVLGVGFGQADAMDKVAAANPDVKFSLIDVSWLDRPNLRQYGYKEHEGSYIVGVAAALATKTNKVGFIGGMDIPLINAFACGYAQGVKSINADIIIYENMVGVTPAAWNDPAKGIELAQSQIDRGADVIFQAAGATGLGVIRAVADAGKLSIGVDSNQNYLAPGSVLTSMLKRVDLAAYNTMKDAMSENFETGVFILGVAEGGVGWALDEHNRDLISYEMKAKLDDTTAKIIAGDVVVYDYRTDNTCKM